MKAAESEELSLGEYWDTRQTREYRLDPEPAGAGNNAPFQADHDAIALQSSLSAAMD